MKKFLVLMFILLASTAQASWFSSAHTNEVAFSSNTINASDWYNVGDSNVACQNWMLWEKEGKVDIIMATDGTPTSPYPKGNTLLAISEKIIWAGTVYSSKLNKRCIWIKGNTSEAIAIYSAEDE